MFSSCESEFIAATAAATQALWLKRLLSRLIHSDEEKITILVDNKSAIALMKNPVFHGRSKHIDTKYHFIRECVERDDIQAFDTANDSTKTQSRRLVMARMLRKSVQAGHPIFVKVLRAVYLATRGVVLGGSGTKGRELAEKLALRQVGAAVLTDKLVNFTEVLGVIARVSKNVHGLWYARLIENM
nr:T-complex protein 11 [Tanacetum cinerariifolium]